MLLDVEGKFYLIYHSSSITLLFAPQENLRLQQGNDRESCRTLSNQALLPGAPTVEAG